MKLNTTTEHYQFGYVTPMIIIDAVQPLQPTLKTYSPKLLQATNKLTNPIG